MFSHECVNLGFEGLVTLIAKSSLRCLYANGLSIFEGRHIQKQSKLDSDWDELLWCSPWNIASCLVYVLVCCRLVHLCKSSDKGFREC